MDLTKVPDAELRQMQRLGSTDANHERRRRALNPDYRATALAKADSHPIRRAIMAHMRHLDRPVTPRELAIDFGRSLGVIAYHVRMLREYGLVSLDHTEPRRGAIQHFYALSASAENERCPASAVANERQRIVERLLHAANLVDPDELSLTAVTLEKMAMVLVAEGGQS
jgi:DNA-binding transcriptional ArsR family regulator